MGLWDNKRKKNILERRKKIFFFTLFTEECYRQSAAIVGFIIFSVLNMVFIIITVPNSYNPPGAKDKSKVPSSLWASQTFSKQHQAVKVAGRPRG